MKSELQYIPNASIDRRKWDECIDNAPNGLIYGYANYLDAMSKNWDALVLKDYEAVMPLTWKRKWNIKYLYQPPLTPQLGIFSANPISRQLIGQFLAEANKHFRFAEIFLNYGNHYPSLKSCDNFVLRLNEPIDALRNRYKKNLSRNLKKAAQFEMIYSPDFDLREALMIHQQQYADRTPHVVKADYSHFEELCLKLAGRAEIICRAAFGKEKNLLAVAVLFLKNNRLYLIEPTTLEAGRKLQANHFLLDAIIEEFSAKDILLDMVGSELPGVANFYQNFGCENQPFFLYRHNQLSWPARLFKKG